MKSEFTVTYAQLFCRKLPQRLPLLDCTIMYFSFNHIIDRPHDWKSIVRASKMASLACQNGTHRSSIPARKRPLSAMFCHVVFNCCKALTPALDSAQTCHLRKISFPSFLLASLRHYCRTGNPLLLSDYASSATFGKRLPKLLCHHPASAELASRQSELTGMFMPIAVCHNETEQWKGRPIQPLRLVLLKTNQQ